MSLVFEKILLGLASSNVLLRDKEIGLYVCEKFTACSSEETKSKILASFTQPNGFVRIVVATIAFGMGLDTINVRTIIHWGLPESEEAYVQETGRSGRDGKQSYAILYYNSRDVSTNSKVNDSIRNYCMNHSKCRRKLLLKEFSVDCNIKSPQLLHLCCDVCSQRCMCETCLSNRQKSKDAHASDPEACMTCVQPNPIIHGTLVQQLESCRDQLYTSSSDEVSLIARCRHFYRADQKYHSLYCQGLHGHQARVRS